MTAPAILEVQIAAEGSFSVVTGRASVVADREVLQSPRRADLSPLRQPSGVVVTIRASETLARAVLRVAESETKRGRIGRSSRVRFLIVTGLARREVASVHLRVRSVAGVTLIVRGQAGRDGQRDPAPQR